MALDSVLQQANPADSPESQAAILRMIAEEQDQLLTRIDAVEANLNATRARVNRTLVSVKKGLKALMGLQREIGDANTTALLNSQNSGVISQSLPEFIRRVTLEEGGIKNVTSLLGQVNASLQKAHGVGMLRQQVDCLEQNLSRVQPDLDKLYHKVVKLETRLATGNANSVHRVVDNAVATQVTGVMEDLGRGWRAVPDPWVK